MGRVNVRAVVDAGRLISVEPFMFFALFGYIVRLVSFQDLLMDRACRNTFEYPGEVCDHIANHTQEQKRSIEVGNNLYTGVMLLTSLPAVVVVIFVGPWSDKYSRKWPLIFAVSGMLSESVTTTLLTINQGVYPIYFMLAGLLSGVTGGFLSAMSFSASYLSDITNPRSRASRFAVMDFFSTCATIFGNVIGGQIFQAFGYLTVISLAPYFHFCALLYAIFLLKETKPPIEAGKRREMFRDLFTFENIKQSYRTCTRKRFGNIRLQIWLLVWVDFSFRLIYMGTLAIAFSYAKLMYKMGVTEYSNANTIFSTVQAIVAVAMVPLLSKVFQLHESAIGLIGILSLMAKMILLSVAHTVPLFYFAMMSGSLSNCTGIAIKSRISKLVSKDELGRAFSLLGIFTSVAPMLGTAMFFQIYNGSMEIYPGMTYVVAFIYLIPSVFIFFWMMRMPTISVGDYGKSQEMTEIQTVSSTYSKLEEKS